MVEAVQTAVNKLAAIPTKHKEVAMALEALFSLAIEVNKQHSNYVKNLEFDIYDELSQKLEDRLGDAYNNYISGTEWQIKK